MLADRALPRVVGLRHRTLGRRRSIAISVTPNLERNGDQASREARQGEDEEQGEERSADGSHAAQAMARRGPRWPTVRSNGLLDVI